MIVKAYNIPVFLTQSKNQTNASTAKPRYKVPHQYNGNLDIKEVFVSTEDWWTNFTA